MMERIINDLVKEKGEKLGVLELRTHLMYFLKGLSNTKEVKLAICKANTKEELLAIVASLKG